MARRMKRDNERLNDMLERYGELCTQEKAAFLLGVGPRTVYNMVQDGRLRKVGRRVDVRSISEYIENFMVASDEPSDMREEFFSAASRKFAVQA